MSCASRLPLISEEMRPFYSDRSVVDDFVPLCMKLASLTIQHAQMGGSILSSRASISCSDSLSGTTHQLKWSQH
jgi:hypothetical protein